jgi:hypothetical protein
VLVDNGCRDFAPGEVARLVPGAAYVYSESNLGFAGGANLGMRWLLRAGTDHVWFLNNDALPQPGALEELVSVIQSDPTIGIVGAKILQRKSPSRIDSIAVRTNLRTGRFYLVGHDEIDRGQYDQLRIVDAVTACAMLVKRGVCDQLGGFDERFFAYFEDTDFCLRARSAGFKVAFAPKARVLHDRPIATQGRQSLESLYYSARNHFLVLAEHGRRGSPLQRRVRTLNVLALNLVYALRAGGAPTMRRLRAVWRGWRDYRRGVVGPGGRRPEIKAA